MTDLPASNAHPAPDPLSTCIETHSQWNWRNYNIEIRNKQELGVLDGFGLIVEAV